MTLLKDAIEVVKGASEKVRDEAPDRTLARPARADEMNLRSAVFVHHELFR
jgi:hypothetical protein